MTGLELFAFVILPIMIVAIGGLGTWLHLRDLERRHGKPSK